jgi:hypothetical protein
MTGRRPAGPTWWPALLPAEASAEWSRLRDWVVLFVDRYGLDQRVLLPCWYRHNRIVETLAALRDHERGSYHPAAHPAAAIEFVRVVRDIEGLLRELTARSGCTGTEHRPDSLTRRGPDDRDWAGFVAADGARRTAVLRASIGDDDEPAVDGSDTGFRGRYR